MNLIPNQKPLSSKSHSMFPQRLFLMIKLKCEVLIMIFKNLKDSHRSNQREVQPTFPQTSKKLRSFKTSLPFSPPLQGTPAVFHPIKKKHLSNFSINEHLKWGSIQEDAVWRLIQQGGFHSSGRHLLGSYFRFCSILEIVYIVLY